jgi:hypothetical protein
MGETGGRTTGRLARKDRIDLDGSADPVAYGESSGEPCAMKVACTVRERAVGKGVAHATTSLAAYFIPNARRNG